MMTFMTCVLALSFITAGQAAPQSDDNRVIASTSRWSITAQQFEIMLSGLPDQARSFFSAPENRRRFLDDLIEMWVLAAVARGKGMEKETNTKALLDFYSNNLVAREYSRQYAEEIRVSDAAIEEYYKTNESDYTEVKLAHILILNADSPEIGRQNIASAAPAAEARKKIEEIQSKLAGGGDFQQLAKEFSQDRSSAPSGGEVGYVGKGQLVAAVEQAAFDLKPGGYSDIVESPYGFHILHVSDRRVAPLNDEVRERIRQRLNTVQLNDEIQSQIKAADVKIDESFFKP